MPLYQYKCKTCNGTIGHFEKVSRCMQPQRALCRQPPKDDPNKMCEYKRVISPVRTNFKFADRRSIKR